jgi:hypothetical protein
MKDFTKDNTIPQNTDNTDTGYLALMEEDNHFPCKVNDQLAKAWNLEEE